MPRYYKGAAPGTHWWTNDARHAGGFVLAPAMPHTPSAVVRHITQYSHPSAYISFSTSFAVARDYALSGGPGGPVTPTNPGYVYEVDTDVPGTPAVAVFHPLFEIAMATCSPGGARPGRHHHDGNQAFIVELASKALSGAPLSNVHKHAKGGMGPPHFDEELRALIYALRDSEVLITSLPPTCIVDRHAVY